MQLNPVASTILVVFYLVTSVALVAIIGFLLYSLAKLNAQLASMEAKINPLLAKTEEVLTLINEKVVLLGERSESILTHGEAVAEEVHEKVDRTAVNVQRTINAPIIGLNSVAAGLARGFHTFRHLQRKPRQVLEIEKLNISSAPAPLYKDMSASSTVETAVSTNGIPVAVRSGREN